VSLLQAKRTAGTTGLTRWMALATSAALVASSLGIAQQAAPSPREIVLTVGKSLVVNSAATIERVAVGYGDLAEARVVGPKEILLDGKAPGETSLIIWQVGGSKLFFDVIVRPNTTALRTKTDVIRKQLQEQLPGQSVVASVDNDTVFLTGRVKDLVSSERAALIAATGGKVVNLLYVDVPDVETQILLKVQFATVDRSVSTDLGLNLISTGATNTIGRVTTGQFSPPSITAPSPGAPLLVTLSDALNFFLLRPDLNLAATIKALTTKGLVEILAEPDVLAINGKPASFLAGGEFPYPILQGGAGGIGTVTVAFREYGIRLNFLPVITPRGTIRLDVAPEVSALDTTSGLTIQGFTIPAITSRKVSTEIELKSGQSFAISGLLDRRLTETLQKIPVLSSVPVLGNLFKSKSYQRQNTELLVIVTPEIVRPIPEGQPLPTLERPLPLWGPTEVPRTPAIGTTGATTEAPSTATIPVEKLLESLKMQNSMTIQTPVQISGWPSSAPIPSPVAAPPATGPIKQQQP
jgi:pilus assembly protein CpaC